MTPEERIAEAVADLDAIKGGDPEASHSAADDVLLWFVPAEVAAAYRRVQGRQSGWWYA